LVLNSYIITKERGIVEVEEVAEEIVAKTNQAAGAGNGGGKTGLAGIIIALIAGLSAIACFLIATNGLVGYRQSARGSGLSATGSASSDFESDLIVWEGSFSVEARTSQAAYKGIKSDAEKVRQYLLDSGVTEDEMVFSSVESETLYRSEYDEFGNRIGYYEEGYEMYQSLKVTSSDVDKVEKISRDITTLLESGISFSSYSPKYYCTELDEVKLELIQLATDNAKQRIDIMAEQAGCQPGELLTANLGVFQITAKNSGTSDYRYDGAFDTSSRYKTATITVKLNYAVK